MKPYRAPLKLVWTLVFLYSSIPSTGHASNPENPGRRIFLLGAAAALVTKIVPAMPSERNALIYDQLPRFRPRVLPPHLLIGSCGTGKSELLDVLQRANMTVWDLAKVNPNFILIDESCPSNISIDKIFADRHGWQRASLETSIGPIQSGWVRLINSTSMTRLLQLLQQKVPPPQLEVANLVDQLEGPAGRLCDEILGGRPETEQNLLLIERNEDLK